MATRPRPSPWFRTFALLTLPAVSLALLIGCGDGIPDFTPEELAEATAQVKEAYRLQDYQYGAELGEEWAGWAPDALELKAWTVANMANGRMVGPAKTMADDMETAHPDSPWSSFALAASRLGSSYSMDDRDMALDASEAAMAELPDLIDAVRLRLDALGRFERDSVDAFFETLPEETLEHPDIRVLQASRSMPQVMEPPDSAIERVVAELEDVLEADPTHIEAAMSASSLLKYFLDDAERANSYVERAAAGTPSPMVHSMLWAGFMEDASLTESERLAKVEADARDVLENGDESPARWAALASSLGSSGLPGLQKEVEEMVLRDHPGTRAAEVVLGNRFRSVARDIWGAPTLNEDVTAEKRVELGDMLREFVGRREVMDPELMLEARWNLFLLENEAGNPDPETLVEVATGLVDYMETEPGSSPTAYYSTVAMALANRTQNLAEASRIIDIGLAELEERLAEEAAAEAEPEEEEHAAEEGAEPVAEEDAEYAAEEGSEEAPEPAAEPEEEGEDPRTEAERAHLLVARSMVLTKEGRFDEADEELTRIREMAEDNRYASSISHLVYLYSGELAERLAEAAEAQGGDADASELLRSADEFYKEGLRGRYYGSPTQGQPWTNPNEMALRSLYERMHGDTEGFDDYLIAVTDEGWEERRESILARREENPQAMQPFVLETLDNEEITSEGLLGKVLVINFWGTW